MATKKRSRTGAEERRVLDALWARLEDPEIKAALRLRLAEDAAYLVPPEKMLADAQRDMGERTLTQALEEMREGR